MNGTIPTDLMKHTMKERSFRGENERRKLQDEEECMIGRSAIRTNGEHQDKEQTPNPSKPTR